MNREYPWLWRKIWSKAVPCVSPQILFAMLQQHNQALPEVKALTAERLRKCRSRINQAVRDGCLEQYLAEFSAAVKKAQSKTFLRGEGARDRRASFDWFVANHLKVYGRPWSLASMKRATTPELLTCPPKAWEFGHFPGHGCGPKTVRFFSRADFDSGKIEPK